jgi:hypothetical protein
VTDPTDPGGMWHGDNEPAVNADAALAAFWTLADNEECDGLTFEARSDQWWRVVATCRHGSYSGVSNGPLDVSRAFGRALERFREQHPAVSP